jgi:hypothetical protein
MATKKKDTGRKSINLASGRWRAWRIRLAHMRSPTAGIDIEAHQRDQCRRDERCRAG